MADPTDEPLVYTTRGNLPAAVLRHETAWQDTPGAVVFRERYYLGDELVKESAHVLLRQGAAATPEQATL